MSGIKNMLLLSIEYLNSMPIYVKQSTIYVKQISPKIWSRNFSSIS